MGSYNLNGSLSPSGYYPVVFCNGNTGFVTKQQYDLDVASGNYGCPQATPTPTPAPSGGTVTLVNVYNVKFPDNTTTNIALTIGELAIFQSYGVINNGVVASSTTSDASKLTYPFHGVLSYTVSNPNTTAPATFTATQVTIQAINGVQKTFVVKLTDWTAFQLSGGVPSSQIINLVNLQAQTSVPNSINDIGTFLAANATGGTTPNPTPTPIQFQVFDLRALDGTVKTFVLSPADYNMLQGQLFGATITNSSVGNSTNNVTAFNLLTSLSAVQAFLTAHQFVPQATPTNYAYNIQLPNNAVALRLVSATNFGTSTTSNAFPAKTFTQSLLFASFPAIPNTLNALFLGMVSDAPNDHSVATYLSTYFTTSGINPIPLPSSSTGNKLWGIVVGAATLAFLTPKTRRKVRRHA